MPGDNQPSADSRAWDRLPGEPARWYNRFDAFRLLGPARSVEQAYRQDTGRRTPAPGEWKKTARRWRWHERAQAWDAETRKGRQEARLAQLARLEEEHAALGLLCIRKARQRLKALQPESLAPLEALRLLLAGAQLRREALTEPASEENHRRLLELENLVRIKTQ